MIVRPWGLLTTAGIVASSATVFGFLGQFSWLLDLFSHFRVQYFLGLAILGVLLLAMKRRRTAVVFLIFAGINLFVVLPLYFGSRVSTPPSMQPIRAMQLNVNTNLGDARRVKSVIEQFNPDLVVLEEISSQWVADLQWLSKSHPHSRIAPREDNFGIGLFSKFPLPEHEIVLIGDAEVPSIIAKVDTGQTYFVIVATHPLPPINADYSRWRNNQLDSLPEYVPSSLPLVLMGDLNATPWNHHFRKLLEQTGLQDSSRGHGFQPTWPSHNPLLWIPIDHFLHSPQIHVVSREIGPNVGSDHYPVIVDFVIQAEQEKSSITTHPY